MNGDTIKLKTISNGEFARTSTVVLSTNFTYVSENALAYADAQELCLSYNLELPTITELDTFYLSNPDKFQTLNTWHGSTNKYWVSDIYGLSGFGMAYDTATRQADGVLLSYNYGVVCTKHYDDISFSVTTKSDPNPAPIANAGVDQTIYYLDAVTLDASASTDNSAIVSYEWKDGSTLLSNSSSFTKTDFSVGTHNLTLTVTDDGGKTSTDVVVVKIYNTFTDILPMSETGGIKSISHFSNGGLSTITLAAGSQLYFKITNNLNRNFTVSKFEIVSTYNGSQTVRASSTDLSLLSNGTLNSGEVINLGYSLQQSQTANYWIGTYTLTDVTTGETFTNSYKWEGTTF
ncbi:MAG: PKD domain-containing protein [Campylobacterales bacterium]|nr:PKD domain-containing protein [Campylobacterales bacterium]